MEEKEYGGYLPLELPIAGEYYRNNEDFRVISLNSGRSGIALAALSSGAKRLLIPDYVCPTVPQALDEYNIAYEGYNIDEVLLPKPASIPEDTYILCINYYGILSHDTMLSLYKKYDGRVIFDLTQAFYCEPVKGAFNIYSMRKFFGVSDGAYLLCNQDKEIKSDFPADVSWDKAIHLIKSIETGTNGAYAEAKEREESMGYEIKLMSKLTQRILSSVDYEYVKNKRIENVCVLTEELKDLNTFPAKIPSAPLYIFPFYCEKEGLFESLVKRKVYVPRLWKELMNYKTRAYIENRLSNYMVPLPIDQRYSVSDIKAMAEIVRDCVQLL
ncbi:MAG: hypothetical protein IJ608_08975 [Lachnospiraceae bacterium]|nr:hypothetical protein [Lachnospiraceae bacterium]